MPRATLRFYAELNDFLPAEDRHQPVERPVHGRPSIKDLIEAAGVPHTEVDLVLVNGESVDFAYPVRDGDRISVYPVFESMDIAAVTRVRPEPLRELRFVLDVHLGRLAAYLRLAWFDAFYRNDVDDAELARIAAGGRVLLTRDQGLLKRRAVQRGYWLRATRPGHSWPRCFADSTSRGWSGRSAAAFGATPWCAPSPRRRSSRSCRLELVSSMTSSFDALDATGSTGGAVTSMRSAAYWSKRRTQRGQRYDPAR